MTTSYYAPTLSPISTTPSSVEPHDEYARYSECLAHIDAMGALSKIRKEVVRHFLMFHPIIVVLGDRRSKYKCIGGISSLTMAQTIYPPDHIISVHVAEKVKPREVSDLVSTDVLMTRLIFAVRQPSALGDLYLCTPAEHLSSLFSVEPISKAAFARRILGRSHYTIFPKHGKNKVRSCTD